MKLVITEKPKVGHAFAEILGCKAGDRKDGYREGNGYIVTWVFGHLFEMAQPEAMNPEWGGRWRFESLPMVPTQWRITLSQDKKAQFALIRRLAARPDVTELVAATDAGREGELIFREVLEHLDVRKPAFRVWAKTQTVEGVREAFRDMAPLSKYDNLAAAALGRARADWLVGLNATRAYTTRNTAGEVLHCGRVQTPTLALVVNRQREIANFKVTTYYEIEATLAPGFKARRVDEARIEDKKLADAIAKEIEPERAATVVGIDSKDVQTPAPPLFNLSALQQEASRRWG